jgi:hypothetical protein
MATFRFQGQFTYPGPEEHAAAVAAFGEDHGMFQGAPIASDVLVRSALGLALDHERTTDNAMEWTGLLSQVVSLAEAAKDGAIVCVYDGPSSSGHKIQRLQLAPGGEISELEG